MRKFIFAILLCIGCSKPSNVPGISPDLRAKFWRAAADYNAVAPQFERVKANLEAVRAELKAACGAGRDLDGDDKGEPICKVALKKSEAKK